MIAHDFNHGVLDQRDHRPWPIPDSPWVMTQTWHDLLFAHWPVAPSQLRWLVPSTFELDLFDGHAWLGIVPFHMTNVAPRVLPALPWVSAFPELNVRTYVRVGNRAGVYFLSLDAGSTLAVRAARILLHLPYHAASMHVSVSREECRYHSTRIADSGVGFDATYAPQGPVTFARPGSLEHFLTERYCLYHTRRDGSPYRLEIHHPPWRLQHARARVARNTMTEMEGVRLPATPPLLHFVKRQDMVAWLPTRL